MKKILIRILAVECAVVVIAMLAVLLATSTKIDCGDCGGDGIADAHACEECSGNGVIDGEAGAACNGTGAVAPSKCDTCHGTGKVTAESPYYSTFLALIPPIIAIGLALVTKEVYSSLLIGILTGGILYANFNPIKATYAVINDGLISAVSDTAGIFIFLIMLGILVALVNGAGGSQAFGRWAEKHIKTRAGAMIATFVLGVLIFIDDYFNCLTVGSVMRPVTDSHKISRVKLAYLIDATAAPVCMIAPISSWAAAVSEYVEDGQGLKFFIMAIPYNFYSLLTLVFIVALAFMGFDYGKMSEFEIKARKGDVGVEESVEQVEEATGNARGRVMDLLIPIAILIVCNIFGLLHVGGFFGGDYSGDLVGAFGNTDATLGLPLGSGVALVVIIIYILARRLMSFGDVAKSVPKGFIAMVPAIIILTLATSLKNMTGLLGAKYFVAGLLENASTLRYILPAIIFVIACGLAFATGTSWGTFGILIPIVSTGIGLDTELGIISMSACLAGAVCGDHCSPISDTTIMSSAGTECHHVDHVATQLPYALTVAFISLVGYLFAGFVQNWMIVLPVMIAVTIGVLFVIRALVAKKNKIKA